MYKFTLPLVLFALLLNACSMQITTVEPGRISPTSPPASETSALPTQTPLVISGPTIPSSSTLSETSGLLYFWPASLSSNMEFDRTKSISSEGGYAMEFTNHARPGTAIVLWAGTEADRYPYCGGQSTPDQIRGLEGCSSMGTGAGASIEWMENGIHYIVGGIGNSMEEVIRFAENLEVIDYQSWQQKFANPTSLSSAGERIEFLPGTTSYSANQELASGVSDEFILGALAGQELTVNVDPLDSTDSQSLVLSVYGLDGSILISESAQATWTDTLPIAQDYVIRVTNRGNAVLYKLTVNIPWRIRLAAGETSTTLAGRLITSMDHNAYLLQARAGQTMTVTTTSPNNNACLTIAARMRDGSYIPLLNAASRPATTWRDVLPTGADYSQEYFIWVSQCPDTPVANTSYTLFVSVTD